MSKIHPMIMQCINHFLNVLQIFRLVTLEEVAQKGCRICILHSKPRKTNPELRWPFLERGLDQIMSRDSFQPKPSCLYNLSGCSPPFLASNSETLLSFHFLLTHQPHHSQSHEGPQTNSPSLPLPGLFSRFQGDYSVLPLPLEKGEVLCTFIHPCCSSLNFY